MRNSDKSFKSSEWEVRVKSTDGTLKDFQEFAEVRVKKVCGRTFSPRTKFVKSSFQHTKVCESFQTGPNKVLSKVQTVDAHSEKLGTNSHPR